MKTKAQMIEEAGLAEFAVKMSPAAVTPLERLIAIVAEECAKVCDELPRKATRQPPETHQGMQACAWAIRERFKQEQERG